MGEQYAAEDLERTGLNPDPAGFQHANYYSILHRELRPLSKIDYGDDENRKAAEVWIETSLLTVMERVRLLGLLAGLPQKGGIRLGVNSPRDWYDDVTKI